MTALHLEATVTDGPFKGRRLAVQWTEPDLRGHSHIAATVEIADRMVPLPVALTVLAHHERTLIDVDTTTHRVTRTLRGFTARLAWCALHGEPVWLFDDGSSQCPHDLVVETNSVHQIVDGPWETEGRT